MNITAVTNRLKSREVEFMNKKIIKILVFVIAATMMFSMAGCKEKTDSIATDSGKITDSAAATKDVDKNIKITQTAAKAVQLENYETSDFSITIPKGWKVTTGGANMTSYVFVNDPNDTRNTMFFILKMEPLLHSQAGKEVWQKMYNSGDQSAAQFAKAPVLEDPSTEGFFKTTLKDFTVTDRFSSKSEYGTFSLGDEILRADYTDDAGSAEGMFTASIVDFGQFPISDGTVIGYDLQTVDGGYYMAYNVMGITTVKNEFIDWCEVLFKCMSSLKYTDSFIDATNKASNEQLALTKKISQNFNESMDGIMSSWENRSKSQDIMSQKQSDATLGYERVYDTETNEIYKATNGFSDVYDGQRFQPVTDDNMYTEAVSGYIEKIK